MCAAESMVVQFQMLQIAMERDLFGPGLYNLRYY